MPPPIILRTVPNVIGNSHMGSRMSNRVLITGAIGRLGKAVCPRLAQTGRWDILATDRRESADSPASVVVADLLEPAAAGRLITGCDAVVHLANHAHQGACEAARLLNENVAMNMNVFHAAMAAGVKHVVFASTIQVVAGSRSWTQRDQPSCLPYLPMDGQLPHCPDNAYALSKVVSEVMLRHMSFGTATSAVAIRFPYLITRDELAAYSRQPIRSAPHSWELLDQCFSFLTTHDAARLIEAILAADLPGFRVYQPAAAGNTLGASSRQLIEQCYQSVPLKRPIKQIDRLIDIEQIELDTGWRPEDQWIWMTPTSAAPQATEPACPHAGPG